MHRGSLLLLLLLSATAAGLLRGGSHEAAATPVESVTSVEKVISLLSKLRGKVEKDGIAEAASYDKFACFCKETIDEKQYNIEQHSKHVVALDASILKLGAELTELAKALSDQRLEVQRLEQANSDASVTRAGERDAYVAEAERLTTAIDATKRAIDHLETSRESVRDGDAEAMAVTASQAHVGEYQSNDVIGLLVQLKKSFTESKRTLDVEEANASHDHNMANGARAQQIAAVQLSIADDEKVESSASADKAEQEEERARQDTARTQELAYRADATAQCEEKAVQFDQRTQARSAELTAFAKALDHLKTGDSKFISSQKKLVGLVVEHRALAPVTSVSPLSDDVADDAGGDDESPSPSFVQTATASVPASVRSQVMALITSQARALNSPSLASLAMKLRIDHFVKVRSMLNDLIDRLEQQATDEKTQKDWCDGDVAAATASRDEAQMARETARANVEQTKGKMASLREALKLARDELAATQKELREAMELRNDERTENARIVAESKEGKSAVAFALNVLRRYYRDHAPDTLVQMGYEPWRHEAAGADNGVFADKAPTTFSGTYHGQRVASTGVLGILQTIYSDFYQTIGTTEDNEEAAQGEFDGFETGAEAAILRLNGEIDTHKGGIEDAQVELDDFVEDLDDATLAKNAALKEIKQLEPMCMATGQDTDERRKRRKQEVEALKSALQILRELD